MTIRKKKFSLHAIYVKRTLLGTAILTSLAGCGGSLNSMLEPERVDYKSASKAPARTLEIPPNLTQLQRDNRYAVQDSNRGIATATGYNLQQQNNTSVTNAQVIAPAATADMHIERAGSQRWLVIKKSPEVLWPQIKDFWQDTGFLINVEMPDAGVMETDWAEKRLNVPQGTVRGWLSKALDTAYDSGIRDKFRTRLERAPDGSTEVYISHRGAEEVHTGSGSPTSGAQSTMWVGRPSDPELEAQMLSQLMIRLGADEVKAKAILASAAPMQQRAKLVKGEGGTYVEDSETFDRAWRRVGLALDRVGFTVEDRDRSQGLYFVRYVDQDKEAKDKAKGEKGFLSRLFTFGSKDDPKTAQRYRISIKEAAGISRIQVMDGEGRPDSSGTAGKILSLLNDQLK